MSPEQARGKAVDRRTDLWAFGCVLYEMLTGQRAFAGEDVAVTLARVAEREPDWAALPAGVPPLIRRLLRRCLEKDRKRRLADASDARLEIEDALSAGERAETAIASSVPDTVPRRVMRMRVAAVGVVVALVVGGSVALGMWLATRPAPLRVGQFPIAASPGTAVAGTSADRAVAITPDGSRVVYVGNNARALFVRSLDTLEPLNLYTGAPRGPFTSPDNQWIGFIDNTSTLKKVAITGGPAATLLTLDGTSRGATWLPNDEIVFATGAPLTGLQQVAAGGGAVTVLTRPDREKGEADHVWPEALPGGRSLLFTIISTTGGTDAAQIAVLDLDTGQQTVVVRGGSHALYVDSGHLIYGAGGTLRAIAFDLATRTTRGAPVAVIPDVMEKVGQVGGGVEAAVAQDGTLAYVRGRGAAQRTLSWVDRQGRETPISAPPRPYLYPRLSPDGGRLAAWVNDQDNDLWLWDMVRVNLTHLTFSPGTDMYPVWALDGHRIVFSSDRDGGQRNLYGQAADGTGPVERLTTSPNLQSATGLTPDGTQLIFTEIAPDTRDDVMQVSITGSHTVTPLVRTPANERNGVVSPDGRWLAYEADDNVSRTMETYVRPYPDVGRGVWQVSTGGGTRPLWSRDGRELFFVSPTNALMRVGVEPGQSWTPTTPTVLLKDESVMSPGGSAGRSYDVSPDGQRFLVLKDAATPETEPPQLIIVQHFDELLKRLVPTK